MSVFKDDGRLYAPAALRNKSALLDLLRGQLPVSGRVLEIASGTGEHAIAFAQTFSGVTFQPSDTDLVARISIASWIKATEAENILEPLDIDARTGQWKIEPVDAVLCINLLHLMPDATDGLLAGAASVLVPGGFALIYGPFDDAAEEAILAAGAAHGLEPGGVFEMPEAHVALIVRKPA